MEKLSTGVGMSEPYNRLHLLCDRSTAQAQVLEHPQWRSQHFPGQSVCPAGPQKHLTSRNHVRVGSWLSNSNFSPRLLPYSLHSGYPYSPHFPNLIPHVLGKFSFPVLTQLQLAGPKKYQTPTNSPEIHQFLSRTKIHKETEN